MSELADFNEEAGVEATHGLKMYGFNVLVRPKEIEEKTAGGVILPDMHKDKLSYSVTEGELIAVSPVAFGYETWPEGTVLPQIGDVVTFSKYVGSEVEGNDGIKYRVMEDKEIIAVRTR